LQYVGNYDANAAISTYLPPRFSDKIITVSVVIYPKKKNIPNNDHGSDTFMLNKNQAQKEKERKVTCKRRRTGFCQRSR
jgi:hypothetical protein